MTLTLATYRNFIAPDIDLTETVFRHTLRPIDDHRCLITIYSNADARNMQQVIEDLAAACNLDRENNEDIYQADFRPEDYEYPEEQWITLGDGDAVCNFWNDTTCEEAEPLEVLRVLYADEFMQPRIVLGNFWKYENAEGIHWTPYEYEDIARSEADDPEEVALEHGYLAYLSADGYMDQTEPALYETYQEACQALFEMHD